MFHLPLRQTEGFMNSLTRIMNAAISIPDFSSISRRSIELPRHALSKAQQPGSLAIVDYTGLKVYGRDEWHQEKHARLAHSRDRNAWPNRVAEEERLWFACSR